MEFTATNALLNLNILASESGNDKIVASVSKAITAPGILVVKQDELSVVLDNITGTPRVYGLEPNGTLGIEFATGAGSATTFAFDSATGTVTLPTSNDYVQYLVRYDRTVNDKAIQITNQADKFPGTIRLILKVLCVDPCSADTLRAAYIDIPSFQVSPESEVTFSSDNQQIDFNGQLQVD